MTRITTKLDQCWDSIAYEYLGDEFMMDEVMMAQYDDEILDYVLIPKGSEILMPETLVAETMVFKAPWE